MSDEVQDETTEEATGEATTPAQQAAMDALDAKCAKVWGEKAEAEPKPTEDGESNEDAQPTLTDKQIDAAKRMGLSADDLAALGDKAQVVADKLVKAQSEIGRRFSELGREKAKEESTKNEDPPKAEELDLEALELELGETGAKIVAAQHKKLQDVEAELAKYRESTRYQEVQRYVERLDTFLGSLDDTLYPELGKSYDPNGPNANEIEALADEAHAILQVRESRGQKIGFEDALKAALHARYPDRIGRTEKKSAPPTKTTRATNARQERPKTKEQAAYDKLAAADKVGFFVD